MCAVRCFLKKDVFGDTPNPEQGASAPYESLDFPSVAGVYRRRGRSRCSDGRFTVTIPAGAISLADVTRLGSAPQVVVSQIAGGSGSTDGTIISLGTWLIQLQNHAGSELTQGPFLQKPITLTYHYPNSHAPVALKQFQLVVNGARPAHLPFAAVHFGAGAQIPVQVTGNLGMSASMAMTASSATGSFATDAPQGWFGKADATHVSEQTGDVSYTIGIATPQGPGGLNPPLNLSYASDSVANTHSPQAAAAWVGQGWSLGLGEITWSESNVTSDTTGTSTWENTWSLSDPFGTSAELIPPSLCFSTYYDDTPCNQPAAPAVTVWHTAPETYLRVVSYTNPTVDCVHFPGPQCSGGGAYTQQPPCFRVWLENGVMEEYGCTPDSRQWYPGGAQGTTNLPSAWLLDLITDPSGNQIHVNYKQVMAYSPSPSNVQYPRDVVLSNITWDAPSCHNAQTMCTGSSWNPLMQVLFDSSQSVGHRASGAPSCAANGSLRCDDPVAETAPNIGTPLITQTQVLNDLSVQVFTNAAWQTLRSYIFSYGQYAASGAIDDPVTGNVESIAGALLLEGVQEEGTDGSTSYPTQTFGYSIDSQQYYEDSGYYAASDASNPSVSGECGGQNTVSGGMATWNWSNDVQDTGSAYPGYCTLWARSYNLELLTDIQNGQGMEETLHYTDLRNNTHGVPAGYNAQDPTVCTQIEETTSASQMPLACRYPDDNGWSHMGVDQRSIVLHTPTSGNANAEQVMTWQYVYRLTALTAQECWNCTVGMYWGDANDGDTLDYYNGRFAGFANVTVTNPDGSSEAMYYETTAGWGVYASSVACHDGQTACPVSPWWAEANAATGQLTEDDTYNTVADGGALLRRTQTGYTVTCPTEGVAADTSYGMLASNLDTDNPVVVCSVEPTTTTTYLVDGNGTVSGAVRPMSVVTTSYADTLGVVLTQTTAANDAVEALTNHSYIYNLTAIGTTAPVTGTYIVQPANTTTTDGTGTELSCAYRNYDGMGNASGQTGGMMRGLETAAYTYTNCAQKQVGFPRKDRDEKEPGDILVAKRGSQ